MKTLIIIEANPKDWDYIAWTTYDCDVKVQFRSMPKVLRAIRRVWTSKGLPGAALWCNDWRCAARDANVIIVFISALNRWLPSYLNGINPNAKVVAWWWNVVDGKTLPQDVLGDFEAWSFDSGDCARYGMRFNHQFYFRNYALPPKETVYDIFFCGRDVGRAEDIAYLYHQFIDLGLVCHFQVVGNDVRIPREIKSNYVSYDEVRHSISESRAILEVTREGQIGPTLRTMEALFFRKKLITDNPHIASEPFFHEENVFILGERSLGDLEEFLHSPMVKYGNEIIDEYDAERWLKRFIEND